MSLRKAYAAAVITILLGAQAWVTFPPGGTGNSWYWPFIDYPMYSYARHPGDAIRVHELRVAACGAQALPEPLTARDLGLLPFRFDALLRQIAERGASEADPARAERDALALLSGLLRKQRGPGACRAELWVREYLLSEQGLRETAPRWRRVRTWLPGESVLPGETWLPGESRPPGQVSQPAEETARSARGRSA